MTDIQQTTEETEELAYIEKRLQELRWEIQRRPHENTRDALKRLRQRREVINEGILARAAVKS